MKEYLAFDDINILPEYSDIPTRSSVDPTTKISSNFEIDIPICASPMDTVCGKEMAETLNALGCIGFVHRFNTIEEQIAQLPDNGLRAAAIGVSGDWWERTQELLNNKVHILLIDVAHGDHANVRRALEKLKSEYYLKVDVVAGNVATAGGAENLLNWGADALRVGLGNGSLCETRIRTGIGVPQVTAIQDCVAARNRYLVSGSARGYVPIIADGGCRYIGDVAKALALGADSVMLGSLLAGTKESPGRIQRTGKWPNEQLFKSYRGSASLEAKIENKLAEKNVEGNSKIIPYKGKVGRIINDIIDGLKSSMSYTNSLTIEQFHNSAQIIRVTPAGQIEGTPHLMIA